MGLNQLLLVLHFLGLAMGFSVGFSNIVMGTLIQKAPPAEKAVLGRFPLAMSRVGDIGLALLWVTGLTLTYTKWSGIGSLPWQFHAKLTAVVLLTLSIGFVHSQQAKLKRGDTSVMPRIEAAGKITMLLAILSVVFAVLTFD
jgi:hypothetical protein